MILVLMSAKMTVYMFSPHLGCSTKSRQRSKISKLLELTESCCLHSGIILSVFSFLTNENVKFKENLQL